MLRLAGLTTKLVATIGSNLSATKPAAYGTASDWVEVQVPSDLETQVGIADGMSGAHRMHGISDCSGTILDAAVSCVVWHT